MSSESKSWHCRRSLPKAIDGDLHNAFCSNKEPVDLIHCAFLKVQAGAGESSYVSCSMTWELLQQSCPESGRLVLPSIDLCHWQPASQLKLYLLLTTAWYCGFRMHMEVSTTNRVELLDVLVLVFHHSSTWVWDNQGDWGLCWFFQIWPCQRSTDEAELINQQGWSFTFPKIMTVNKINICLLICWLHWQRSRPTGHENTLVLLSWEDDANWILSSWAGRWPLC